MSSFKFSGTYRRTRHLLSTGPVTSAGSPIYRPGKRVIRSQNQNVKNGLMIKSIGELNNLLYKVER
jgi:hypothetical protein